jgi:hypothetical protein
MEASTIEKIQNIKDISFYQTEFYFKSYIEQLHQLKKEDFINENIYKMFRIYKQCIGLNCFIDGEKNGIGFVHPDSHKYFNMFIIMINETDNPKLYKLWKTTKKYNLNHSDNEFKFICYFECKETKKKYLYCKPAEKWLFSEKYKNMIKKILKNMTNIYLMILIIMMNIIKEKNNI